MSVQYQLQLVEVYVSIGAPLHQMKAALVQAALDHGTAVMQFNDKKFVCKRDWLLEVARQELTEPLT